MLKNSSNQIIKGKWEGETLTGVKIRIVLDESGKVITAYPIKP